jgi:hypothetical protein
LDGFFFEFFMDRFLKENQFSYTFFKQTKQHFFVSLFYDLLVKLMSFSRRQQLKYFYWIFKIDHNIILFPPDYMIYEFWHTRNFWLVDLVFTCLVYMWIVGRKIISSQKCVHVRNKKKTFQNHKTLILASFSVYRFVWNINFW